jgi:hypothetical protein
VQTANNLEASAVVSGLSSKMTAQEQAFYLGHAWEAMPEPKRQFIFQVVYPESRVYTFHIGPHTPSLKTEDVHLVHRLWLNITREPGLETLHHHDILTEALTRFAREYSGHDRQDILRDLRKASGATVTSRALGDSGQWSSSSVAHPIENAVPDSPASDEPAPDKNDEGPPSPPMVGP